jgi:signal transduction histidine kinase
MTVSRWFHVEIRTDDDHVFTSTSDDAGKLFEDGTVRRDLTGGLTMVATPRPEEARRALARALVHELRSPLNALGIYVDLLSRPAAEGDGGPSPAQLAEKAQSQIHRLNDLLQSFLSLATPTGSDLTTLLGSFVRLANHESMRRGGSMKLEAGGPLPVQAEAGLVVDALVRLVDAVWSQPEVNDVTLRLTGEGVRVRLEVDGALPPAASLHGPFTRCGATVALEEGRLVVLFPAAGSAR